jgi:histidyl-tRNA synthetase
VFEWVSDRLGAQSAICSGGRYDGLFEQLGGKPTPGCGFGIGVERTLLLLEESKIDRRRVPDAYIVHQGAGAAQFAFRAAESMRDRGLAVTLDCSGAGFKSQMKKADASGARYAVIIGDDEVAAGQVSVKSLRVAAEQTRRTLDEATETIANTMDSKRG